MLTTVWFSFIRSND